MKESDLELWNCELRVSLQVIGFKLKEFMEQKARLCSKAFGCITPLYVYSMLGGAVAIEDIATAMAEVRLLR
jgi:hypothetical protein